MSRTAAFLASDDREERATALLELTRLADTKGVVDATQLAPTTVRISGLGVDLAQDERALKVACSRFGTVLEATACVPESALVTFEDEAGCRRALEGAAELGEGVTAQRTPGSTDDSDDDGEAARQAHKEHRRRVGIALAAAAVAPLVDSVLCADASRVSSTEARQANLVLARLLLLDPVQVGVDFVRDDRFLAAWAAESSALGVVLAKEPTDLTLEDTLLLGCDGIAHIVVWYSSWLKAIEHAGLDEGTVIGSFFAHCVYWVPHGWSDERAEQLMLVVLETCRNDLRSRELSELELGGLWWVMSVCIQQRPAVGAAAIKAGILEAGAELLRNSSPHEWVSWRETNGFAVSSFSLVVSQFPMQNQPGCLKLYIEHGIIEAAISALQVRL